MKLKPSQLQKLRPYLWALLAAELFLISALAVENGYVAWSQITTVLWTFIVSFVIFSVTVLVHELGHFLAAKHKGLVIEKFAIGFGPKVLGWKRGGVEYVLNWFPLGGFVQLPQMAAMDMVEGKSDTPAEKLPETSPWAKIVTAFWGPMFSFLLAVVLAFVVYFIGLPQNAEFHTTTIGYVEPGSPAAEAGIQPGDKIIRINGEPIERWAGRKGGVMETILLSRGKTVKVDVERNGEVLSFDIIPEKDPELQGLRSLGFEKYFARTLVIDYVLKNSPAEKAGMLEGDKVIALDGEPVYSAIQVARYVSEAQKPIELTYIRDGERRTASMMPQEPTNHHSQYLGIIWAPPQNVLEQVSPWEMITTSLTFIYKTLRAVGSSESEVGVQHLSGPVGIFDKIMSLLTVDWRLVIYFGVILNVNLAVINLMPIPILDGGHIVLCVIEAIRRRPLEPKLLYGVQMAFFALLIGLFLFITYNDIWRIGKRVGHKEELVEIPTFEESS